QEADERYEEHAPARIQPEDHRDDKRSAAVHPRLRRVPGRFGGDDLMRVHGGGEDRCVSLLKRASYEGHEHPGEGRAEEHRGGDNTGADEFDVAIARDDRDERAEAEAEREQIERWLDD